MSRMRRRELLKGAAISAFAGVTILPSKGMLAPRDQKLVYWHLPTFAPAGDDAVQAQFDDFRKMAGLAEKEVAFVPTPRTRLISRLSRALATGTAPDVVRLNQSDLQWFRTQGHMLDVSDVVERMQARQGGLFDRCLRAIKHENRYWGVPFAIGPRPMHARLDLLEANGLAPPRTWDAFVAACKKIQKPPFYGFGMDLGRTVDATNDIMQVCWGFGGRIFDAGGNAAFDNEGNVRGFALINEMYNRHKIIPREAVGNSETEWNNKAYQSGRVAFINNVTSVYAYLAVEDPELMKRTGLLGVPAGPAGAYNRIDTWSLGLFKQSPYPELAKGLAQHLMDPEPYNEVILANDGRFVPVYPDLLDDARWTERPEFGAFAEIAASGVPISHEGPPSAASGKVLATHVIPNALRSVLLDAVDPAEAVARAHQKIAALSESLASQRG